MSLFNFGSNVDVVWLSADDEVSYLSPDSYSTSLHLRPVEFQVHSSSLDGFLTSLNDEVKKALDRPIFLFVNEPIDNLNVAVTYRSETKLSEEHGSGYMNAFKQTNGDYVGLFSFMALPKTFTIDKS